MTRFSKTKLELKKLPESKQERAKALLSKAEFMEAELEKLQKILKEKGWTEEYYNGANQHGLKKSSEADIYNTLVKNYASIIKQLDDMAPVESANKQSKLSELMNE